ncbi:DUF2997 domain-containing protein [Synechococcus sp. H55.11]|uniref:DUF2997 domain-containing protein n=1 Tax=unclassified Synechococcus TaxID=2626047 RepID=UPI0039C378E2
MAEYQQVEYIIDKDGNVIERVLNVKGKGCLDLTEEIERALGTVQKRELLPEYDQAPVIEQDVQRQVERL